jgi:hypothetical protein
MKLSRFLQTFLDPARAIRSRSVQRYSAVEAGPLRARRLEERRVLAVDVTAALASDSEENPPGIAGSPQPLTVPPLVTVPGNQATFEGSPLIFSAATGRLIRIDDPDIGADPLVVDLTAFESLGGAPPYITLASTAGLTSITGNGTNVLRLEGTLADINAALSYLTFYAVDNGDFTVTVTATDNANSEADSASFQVQAANANPQINFSTGPPSDEGEIVQGSLYVFDPGVFDDPQISWVVSYGGADIASGVGPSVQFFAAEDGAYELTAMAVDKDGAVALASDSVLVTNVVPTLNLNGFIRDGVVHLTIFITDPGREQFTIEVFWTAGATTAESFFTTETTLTVSHRYTPEELDSASASLSVFVLVKDNADITSATLHFVEGAPPESSPPKFAAAPLVPPPDRVAPSRSHQTSTSPQIVSPDVGRAAAQGKQEEVAIHQFVLRVVGPDGEESSNYPLPAEALANLPAFLTELGVPDGHYRVYLVTGELERLVIDAHLRAGRIIDPRDESQPTFDRPPASDDAAQLAAANAIIDVANGVVPAAQPAPLADIELAAVPTDPHLPTDADGKFADDEVNPVLPLLCGTIIVGATAVGYVTLRAPTLPVRDARREFPRFTKAACWARKLKYSS